MATLLASGRLRILLLDGDDPTSVRRIWALVVQDRNKYALLSSAQLDRGLQQEYLRKLGTLAVDKLQARLAAAALPKTSVLPADEQVMVWSRFGLVAWSSSLWQPAAMNMSVDGIPSDDGGDGISGSIIGCVLVERHQQCSGLAGHPSGSLAPGL